jgi:hypothetical protein
MGLSLTDRQTADGMFFGSFYFSMEVRIEE